MELAILNLSMSLLNSRSWSDRRSARSVLHTTTREMRDQANKPRKMEHEHGRAIGELSLFFYGHLDIEFHTTADQYIS